MSFAHFIQQANHYGKLRQSFFFLIDFEQKKPLIYPFEQAAKCGLFFDIFGQTNAETTANFSAEPLNLQKIPMDLAAYEKGFTFVQNELQKGNSYLLNLTYPTEISINYSLEQLFQQSQAKYKLWLKDQFVCFSPECFVRTENNQIFTYPMKGTIDATLPNAEQQLLDSEKEKQEHYTIVDLMRNDLAMVAEKIRVSRFRYVDKIETERGAILQTSSEIVGDLAENWQENIGSMLAKLLPAGSISGAPKEKTVEIIRQAEQGERGYYTGVFGLFDGENLHSAVAIRFIEQQGNRYYFRSGGGITRHSLLTQEYAELLQKVYIPLKTPEKCGAKTRDFPLFETLCLENGELKNMALHQQRYEQSLVAFYGENAVKIHDLATEIRKTPEFLTALCQPIMRCRVSYNAENLHIQFFPYERKSYRSFQPVICDDIDYGLKYQNRSLLNELLAQRENCDEILIVKNGKITDCSIGNLIFRQGDDWITPDEPLLNGTQRQFLLAQGKIKEQPIFAADLNKFDEIRLINAMNGLD